MYKIHTSYQFLSDAFYCETLCKPFTSILRYLDIGDDDWQADPLIQYMVLLFYKSAENLEVHNNHNTLLSRMELIFLLEVWIRLECFEHNRILMDIGLFSPGDIWQKNKDQVDLLIQELFLSQYKTMQTLGVLLSEKIARYVGDCERYFHKKYSKSMRFFENKPVSMLLSDSSAPRSLQQLDVTPGI